jgi:hypothetical protein
MPYGYPVMTHFNKDGMALCGTHTESWRLVKERPACKKCRKLLDALTQQNPHCNDSQGQGERR